MNSQEILDAHHKALDEKITKLQAALKPFAEKWLYPDDLGGGFFDPEDIDDDALEEVWVKRAWVRAAREALK